MEPAEREPQESLNALEHRLGQWRPASGILGRDRMMFEAGRAAARSDSRRLFGLVSSGCLLLVAVGLGGLLVHERNQRQALEAVLAAKGQATEVAPPASTVVAPADPNSYLMLTHRMIGSSPDDDLSAPSAPSPARPSLPTAPPLTPLRSRRLGGGIEL
jgi:hypothetical protein